MRKTKRLLRWDDQHPWRNDNLGRLLLSALAQWQGRLIQGLQEIGFEQVRSGHITLLRHLDVGGTRITEIADRAGVSKQAIGQLITACKKLNLVTTVPDPTDRRAKVVLFTNHGRSLILAERAIIDRIEAENEALLGRETYQTVRAALEILIEQPAAPRRRRLRRASASSSTAKHPP